MSWPLRLAWRDGRGARRLLLFVLSVALGVAALVAIRSFGVNLRAAVSDQSRALTGSDLTLATRQDLTDAGQALIDSVAALPGAERADELAFTSMAYFPGSGGSRLTEVRAVRGGFPFYGTLGTRPAGAAARYQAEGTALVDASLLLQMDADVGDSVRVGQHAYRIAGAIEEVSGQTGIGAFVGPRVYVPLDGLDSTLIGFGTRVTASAYFKLPAPVADPDGFEDRARAVGLRADTPAEANEEWGEALGWLTRFLALVGFVALLLGGIGVASAVGVYVRQKAEAVATLRCLGARAWPTLAVFVAQAAAMGLFGALAGAALGVGVQAVLPRVLAPFLPVEVPVTFVLAPVLEGLGVGVAVALGFALLPLVAVRRIPPLRALRTDAEADGRDALRWLVGGALALGVVAFAWAQTEDWKAALGFAAGTAAALGLLALGARAVTAAVRRLLPQKWPWTWRQGLSNLYRPGNQTGVLLLTLGLGTFLIATLWLVQASVLEEVRLDDAADRPGLILFDIQQDQRAGVEAALAEAGAPVQERAAVVTMRLAAVEGTPADAILADTSDARPGWALRREYRSTYRSALTDTETLVEGEWVGRADPDAAVVPISLEQDIAADLGVGVGSRLTFDVQGVPVETEVASLRRVDWAAVSPNFFAVFPEGPLDRAPQFWIVTAAAPSPEAAAAAQRAVVRAYANVSVVDVRLVLGLLEGVLGRVAFVLQFMAGFSVLTGLVVLAAAVGVSRLQRIEEGVLLRTLGASRDQVSRVFFAEYALLGLLAAFVGVVLALAASWALARFAFEVAFVPAWGAVAVALVAVPLLTVVVGVLGSRGVLGRSPLEVLRAEG